MAAGRESWAKVGGITATACLIGGLYYGLLRSLWSQAGFVRDLFSIIGLALVGAVCALALQKNARHRYLNILIVVVGLQLASIAVLKCGFKDVIVAGFSATMSSMNYLTPAGQEYLKEKEKTEEYWRNY